MSLEEESLVCRHYRVAADMLGKRWTPISPSTNAHPHSAASRIVSPNGS